MRHCLSLSIALALACWFAPRAVSQQYPENWHSVAAKLGGSGVALAGNYVRLIPSRAWHPSATPPMWLAFSLEEGERVVRGSIPVLREDGKRVVAALARHLPKGHQVDVRNCHGVKSPHVQVRFVANGSGPDLAAPLRKVYEAIEPGALARIDTTGYVTKETFECEDFLVVRAADGVSYKLDTLPAAVAVEGTRVRLVATRRGTLRRFGLFGGFNGIATRCWTSLAKLDKITAIDPLPRAKSVGDRASWLRRCEQRARELLDDASLQSSRLTLLATGFDALQGAGFAICPRCHRAMVKRASISCCEHEHLFYLGHDGFDHGPFRLFAPAKETR